MKRVRPWAPKEDDTLQAVLARGMSWPLVARTLNRSRYDVQAHADAMGLERAPNRADKGARTRLVERDGWPVLQGSEEDREQRFIFAVLSEAHRAGVIRVRA